MESGTSLIDVASKRNIDKPLATRWRGKSLTVHQASTGDYLIEQEVCRVWTPVPKVRFKV